MSKTAWGEKNTAIKQYKSENETFGIRCINKI